MYSGVVIQRCAKKDVGSFTANMQSEGMLFLKMKAEGKSHDGPEQNTR